MTHPVFSGVSFSSFLIQTASLQDGAPLNQRHQGATAVHRAVSQGHLSALEQLAAGGAKLRLKDPEGGRWV